jgi:putative peptide maturation system protein
VHDFREGMLLSVDAEALSVGETVATIDELLEHASLRERLIDACVINGELKRRNYAVSDEELQREMDAIRRRRGLVTAADTERWMRARGMSHQQLEQMAELAARTRQLRRELCAADVETFFAAQRETLERAALVRLRFANAELARRAGARVSSRESFFALAEQLLGQDARHAVTVPRLDGRVVSRHGLEPALAAQIFAGPGTIVGPQVTPDGAYLLYVSAIERARELDTEQRELIERELFARWLERQRALAIIDWNWGRDS